MRSVLLLCVFISMLSSCSNIAPAPDEHCDNNDTRIGIKEASVFDLDPFWFKEDTTSSTETLLAYKQNFEATIIDQIIQSPVFNQPILSSKKSSGDLAKGSWRFVKNGYQFFQYPEN